MESSFEAASIGVNETEISALIIELLIKIQKLHLNNHKVFWNTTMVLRTLVVLQQIQPMLSAVNETTVAFSPVYHYWTFMRSGSFVIFPDTTVARHLFAVKLSRKRLLLPIQLSCSGILRLLHLKQRLYLFYLSSKWNVFNLTNIAVYWQISTVFGMIHNIFVGIKRRCDGNRQRY